MHRPAPLAAVLLLLATPVWAAETIHLAAHRALYRMTLDQSRSGDVVGASGTMGYEVIDACDGWAVRQRLEMTITNTDGQNIQMISDYATWELKDGLRFRFHVRQTTDRAVTSQTDGDAKLDRPEARGWRTTRRRSRRRSSSDGHAVPDGAYRRVDRRRGGGEAISHLPLFDGTDENWRQYSSIVILDWRKPEESKWPHCPTAEHARAYRVLRAEFGQHDARLRGGACATGKTAWRMICEWISATS